RFKYHIDEKGESPMAGDEIYYRMYVRLGDSVVHRSFNSIRNERPFSIMKMPDVALLKNKLKPHEDALRLMSPGDSITIYYTTDTLDRKPLGFEDANYIFYDLVMVDIKKNIEEIKPVPKEAKPLPVEEYEVTPNGYPVVFHVNKEGATPRVGEYINFRMYIRNDDEVIFSTEKNKIGNESYKTAPYIITDNISPQMDAFGMMSPGDSLTLYYQIDTMDRKPKGFEDSDMVYYDIVLLDIQTTSEYNSQQRQKESLEESKKQAVRNREAGIKNLLTKTLQQYKNNELSIKLRSASSGLKYMILEKGNGISIESANTVNHHFYCMMDNGETFGSSFPTGEPYSVLIGTRKVISGWESGLRLFEEGSKGILFVPSELAYGAEGIEGKVPPNTDLIFYIDVEEVRK
ncbi:MAG: FKBP-type peptidyl-prolyl cis-trans isomerase, partial [Bacteroidota bacterium]